MWICSTWETRVALIIWCGGVLRELAEEYPDIRYAVVLAYLPEAISQEADFSDTMLPEGVETIHPKYAITWRNNWMLRESDYVVTYNAAERR